MLCGSLKQMSKEYVYEPLGAGWKFDREYVHRYRSPVYREIASGRVISVKLAGESWFPGCENMGDAYYAWEALKTEWQVTGLPLLSSPAATGKTLLWETLPDGEQFPELPADVAILIHAHSPQHRKEHWQECTKELWAESYPLYGYDGRWMYAGACLARGRFPVGAPRRAGGFKPYVPGWHHVAIKIPKDWNHIGLIPIPDHAKHQWCYPNQPGEIIRTWVSEPELTLAISQGWEITEHYDGYTFDKGQPLEFWARKLAKMRLSLGWQCVGERVKVQPRAPNGQSGALAHKAVREILNHTIGSLAARGFQREQFIPDAAFTEWRRAHWREAGENRERVEGGWIVPVRVPSESDFDIYMPHWAAQIWALERAWMAKHALRIPYDTLIEIDGDCLYTDRELTSKEMPSDDMRLSRLRRKD
jgi:hypothetical protein